MSPLKSCGVRFASKQPMLLMHLKSCKIKVYIVYGVDDLYLPLNKTWFNK